MKIMNERIKKNKQQHPVDARRIIVKTLTTEKRSVLMGGRI